MAPVSVVESTQKSFFFFFLQFILIFIFISSFSVFSHRRFGSRSRSAALGMEVGTPTWGGVTTHNQIGYFGRVFIKISTINIGLLFV